MQLDQQDITDHIISTAECRAAELVRETGLQEDFEDFRQEVCLRIIEQLQRHSPTRSSVRTYIVMLSRTAATDILRRLRKHDRIRRRVFGAVRNELDRNGQARKKTAHD